MPSPTNFLSSVSVNLRSNRHLSQGWRHKQRLEVSRKHPMTMCLEMVNRLRCSMTVCVNIANLASYHATKTSVQSVGPIGRTDGNVDLDRTDRSQRSRWTGPIGPGNKDGPSRTDSIGSTRLGPKSVGLGRSRSVSVRSRPRLSIPVLNDVQIGWKLAEL